MGLKLWSTNYDLIDEAVHLIDKKVFDYIELLVIPGTPISPFIIDVPFIIHIPHQAHGVNIGEMDKKEYNLRKINECLEWADRLEAEYLILHAGYGSMKYAKELLNNITDSRILIENMPKVGINGESMIGYTSFQIKELIDNNMGFCLDFGHAVKAAFSVKMNYKDYIKEFLKLKPEVFHISDGMLSSDRDEHLNIDEGEYDIEYMYRRIIECNKSRVTLETPRHNISSLHEDILNAKLLKNKIV